MVAGGRWLVAASAPVSYIRIVRLSRRDGEHRGGVSSTVSDEAACAKLRDESGVLVLLSRDARSAAGPARGGQCTTGNGAENRAPFLVERDFYGQSVTSARRTSL